MMTESIMTDSIEPMVPFACFLIVLGLAILFSYIDWEEL
jgi:hypothetical protein